MSTRKDPYVINIFLVLIPLRIKVERGRVRDVSAGFVRNDGDIVADLVLIRIPLRRIKWVTHSNIGRPRNASIGAIGVEQL